MAGAGGAGAVQAETGAEKQQADPQAGAEEVRH